MTPYTLSLPVQLQQEAEKLAALKGISLDQFILGAVAEKVAALKHHYSLDELIEAIAPEKIHNEIDSGVAVGNEIW
ncbi:AbrB/MazE/SpoVT family DNA-binding domain-containing protein [Microcoleus sp. N9_A1]|uniref:AbrB/MazE/SpoVT family DNA-binding domain-containing protein n=1 Tax=Microcoleus sp. N9_A1 TaxID=3055380 RepID=UPI002FD02279